MKVEDRLITSPPPVMDNNNLDDNNEEDRENGNVPKPFSTPCVAPGIAQVTPWLFLSGANAVREPWLRDLGVTCVVNATAELPDLPLDDTDVIRVGVGDSPGVDLGPYLDMVADKIEEVRRAGGRTLVHCTAGVSRSASLCLAYLMKYEHMALRKAFSHLRSVRPAVRPNSGFFRQLIELERRLLGHETVAMVHNAAAGMQIPDVYEVDYQKMLWFQQNYRTSLGRH